MDKVSAIYPAAESGNYAARLIGKLLEGRIQQGHLTIILPTGSEVHVAGRSRGRVATIQINQWRAVRKLMLRGGVGFAEGYLDGDWDTPVLSELLMFIADNLTGIGSFADGLGVQRLMDKLGHRRNRNSKTGSRRNIAFHYDLGNDFYQQWLDDSMSYSAGIFTETNDLLESQHAKYSRLTRVSEVKSNHRVLEIGCGWGGLLEHLSDIGCDATGISISQEQVQSTSDRLASRGNARVRLQDYRDVEGQYDRVLSIEMFEAVGEEYWDTFAQQLSRLLTDDGIAAMQIITIDEDAFDDYRGRPDFIQQYVFPGGMLPSVTHIDNVLAKQGLQITDVYRFGKDYARTMQLWRARFEAAWPVIESQGFDERFRRLWMYYLCYCEAGFQVGRTDVVQIRIERV
jgi:cyclopropane-fatty-acyl-phospholipid synthase